MGLLSLGTPLNWHESKKWNEHVRSSGIQQLANIFKQHSCRKKDHFFWGDEVEYMLVDINEQGKTARLSIDQDHILEDMNDPENPAFELAISNNILFHPEYGRFMLEATPLKPYDGDKLDDYLYVEKNMIQRRKVAEKQLPKNIVPITLTSFPRMGCNTFTSPPAKPIGPASQSLFLPDEIINRHVRFPTLTANIRRRRGAKVAINLPLYPDINTKLLDDSIPKRDLFPSDKEAWIGGSIPGHVYLDSMGFGMGSSCLQVTMQAQDIDEARYLYDSLAPLTAPFLALSAAAPIFKGFLVNQDVRWNVISGAVDDRTFVERNEHPYPGFDSFGGLDVAPSIKRHIERLGGGVGVNGDKIINEMGDTSLLTLDGKPIQKIPKSRYDSIDSYLGGSEHYDPKYNDINPPINGKILEKLLTFMDEPLARHFAHIFIRDPLVLFSERIHSEDSLDNDHFENIQSTNWQTLRFKPPGLYSEDQDLSTKPGWRVEFRPLEIQLTDFENAAYSVFITLLSRAIIKYKPNFYTPISKIDENMKIAHKIDSALKHKFWFRNLELWGINCEEFAGYDLSWFDRFNNTGNDELGIDNVYINGYKEETSCKGCGRVHPTTIEPSDEMVMITLGELINGKHGSPGLIHLVVKFVATEFVPDKHHSDSTQLASNMSKIQNYLRLISYRADGKIPTVARWIRNIVISHPKYNKDSKVSDEINYDIIKKCWDVTNYDPSVLSDYFGDDLTQYLKDEGY